jgi:hypothetical protein
LCIYICYIGGVINDTHNPETAMTQYRNNNDRYGCEGPFEAGSKQELIDEMLPVFHEWAEKNLDYERDLNPGMPPPEQTEFFNTEIARMCEEFRAALELVA